MNIQNLFKTPVYMKSFQKELLADMNTPVSTYFKINGESNSFLLESMEGNGNNSRYSILGVNPLLIFRRFADRTEISAPGSDQILKLEGNPFDHIKMLLKSIRFDRTEPFECGFLCGYLSYDTIRYIEKIPDESTDDLHIPEMLLIIPSEVIIFDNFSHTIKLIVHLEQEENTKKDTEKIASERLNQILKKFSRHIPQIKEMKHDIVPAFNEIEVNIKNDEYKNSVLRAKEYIRQGDIFQVVLSRRFQKTIKCDAFDIYRMLHVINPSPYMFYLNFGDIRIVGSSPETMVKYDGVRVTVRPIAGTRKRGKNTVEDREIANGLLKDEKELAEHMMLVDLGRNDVGRIARYGTVRLDTLKAVENYSHVMHIVSTVSGELRDGVDSVDIFKACFPAGTVSGAPKIRAMEIIDELETTRRHLYAGAVGYFDFQDRMDTCIAIRTLLIKGATAYWQAGGGLVADSEPEYEFQETENKARALLNAITLAEEITHDTSY